ncbi:uracil-DNA glycosylase [[Mycoplasma] collis]|uniref:uracil-DNA glycosylase n=1 Tax=[Mycoplasma] collis TaxID=2127 RepID=UPI001B8052B2|nr:uracil-DNA glycosylase [[Mycoplasma] collis]
MTNNLKINKFLKNEFNKDYFKRLNIFLDNEYLNKIIYPKRDEIFNFLKLTNFNDLKIVIIGQDPYHGENEAHGLAFSTLNKKLPPSLKNIYIEIKKSFPSFVNSNGNLEHWSKQGILLLNRILTVQKDKPLSHKEIGWETFSLNLLKFISQEFNNIIFLLLGKKAQEIKNKVNLENQIILELSHPSPFSYRISFKDSGIFKKINEFLVDLKKDKIKW